MFETNAKGKVRLYFTEDKVCIGSYDHLPVKIREVLNCYPLNFINILFQDDVICDS